MIDIPGYKIKREVSTSATATVLLAEQTSLDREVAIKLLPAALVSDKVQTERFLQIARTLASFSHPNIVAVYDVGLAQDQTPYYSMQYLSGGDFLARAQRGISDPDLTETLASIARALGYVHERGMIHRAVTPQNVLYDAYNTPVLVDFGIAPAPSQDAYATSAGFAVEAGRYMSPEQARGGELSARSDIYSLGALCFYGLTGRPPYDGVDGFAVAYAHVFEPIPRLPPAKAHWQTLVDGALAKDPKDRYANTDEFLAALTRVGSERAATPELVAPAAAAPPAEPAAARVAEPVAPPVAPAERAPAGGTIIAPRVPRPEAPVAPEPKRPGTMRLWPVAVAALGVVLIAAALLLPKRAAPPEANETPAVAAPATAPAPAESATPAPATPAPAEPAAAAPNAAPSGPTDAVAAPDSSNANESTEPAPESGLKSLDAAEAQAEADLTDPTKAPTVVDPLSEAIRLGRIDLAGQRLTSPPGTNALERFQLALKLEPKSRSAHQGIVDVAKKYVELADKNPPDNSGGAVALANYVQTLQRAEDVARLVPEGSDVLKETATRRRKAAEPLLAQARSAADAWDKAAAKADYEQALQIDPENAAARDGIKFVATIGEPGFAFRDKIGDSGAAPPMVVMPGAGIALARHPVTRAEFRRFWDAAGRAQFNGKDFSCRDRESIFRSSKKRGWDNPDITQDDNHPVVCVTWPQAAAYAQWLAKQTGKRYRLPSPAEFDAVAARAGRGDCSAANLADAAYNKQFESRDGAACDDGFAATAPVERFAAIEGVYDIDGNVREWVGACGNGSAAAAESSCRDFRVKGRGWLSPAAKEAATASDTYAADVGLNTVGFRVARDLGK